MKEAIMGKSDYKLTFGTKTLSVPNNPKLFLICQKVCDGEQTLRESVINSYSCKARENLDLQGKKISGSLPAFEIEKCIEEDIRLKGNEYVLNQLYEWGYYCLQKDMVSFADDLYNWKEE